MNAAQIVKEATAVGIHIAIDGDNLLLEAPTQPPAAVVDLISRHKPDIVLLLRFGSDGFAEVFAALEGKCPDYVDLERWRQCLDDALEFLATWGRQAEFPWVDAQGSVRTEQAACGAPSVVSTAFPLRRDWIAVVASGSFRHRADRDDRGNSNRRRRSDYLSKIQ